jgi:uncharacterized YigZ family protein
LDDTYQTLSQISPTILFKEKNSKFYGIAFPVTSEEEIKQHLDDLKKQYSGAGHFCYAYQLGSENKTYRVNDDGEPNNSAGMPIYGQIQSFKITNVLVVVIRFFGGVKLGVGGLISAYRNAAQMALQEVPIIEKTVDIEFTLKFEYKNLSKVMRILKEENAIITNQKLEISCEIFCAIRKKNAEKVFDIFTSFPEIKIKKVT